VLGESWTNSKRFDFFDRVLFKTNPKRIESFWQVYFSAAYPRRKSKEVAKSTRLTGYFYLWFTRGYEEGLRAAQSVENKKSNDNG
jgi:hypothetical protein